MTDLKSPISNGNGKHSRVEQQIRDLSEQIDADAPRENNYEWLGDDELTGEKDVIAKEIMGEEYSKGYASPIRVYDTKIKADKK